MPALANQNPLEKLHGIVEPTRASIWPLAPIYWWGLLLLIIFVIAAFYLFKNIRVIQRKNKQGLIKLQQLQIENANFITLNKLLKGIALAYFPRERVASLYGEAWFDFIQGYSDVALFSGKESFLRHLYQYSEQPCSMDHFNEAKTWIKQLPKQIRKHKKEAIKHV